MVDPRAPGVVCERPRRRTRSIRRLIFDPRVRSDASPSGPGPSSSTTSTASARSYADRGCGARGGVAEHAVTPRWPRPTIGANAASRTCAFAHRRCRAGPMHNGSTPSGCRSSSIRLLAAVPRDRRTTMSCSSGRCATRPTSTRSSGLASLWPHACGRRAEDDRARRGSGPAALSASTCAARNGWDVVADFPSLPEVTARGTGRRRAARPHRRDPDQGSRRGLAAASPRSSRPPRWPASRPDSLSTVVRRRRPSSPREVVRLLDDRCRSGGAGAEARIYVADEYGVARWAAWASSGSSSG